MEPWCTARTQPGTPRLLAHRPARHPLLHPASDAGRAPVPARLKALRLLPARSRSGVVARASKDAAQQLQDASSRLPLPAAFAALAAATAAAAGGSLLVPHRLWPSQVPLVRAVGSTLWLQAAALWALKGAAAHGRLGSDTYKRLSGALVLWGGGIAVASSRAASLPRAAWALAALAAAAGAVAGAAAAGERALGVPDVPRLASGLTNVTGPWSGALAAAATLCLALGAALLAGHHLPALGAGVAAAGFPRAAYAAGLCFAGAVLYTLKDAEDRGRAGASTFQLLGQATALAAACHAGAAYAGGLLSAAGGSALLAAAAAAFVAARRK